MARIKDETGKKYGELLVLSRGERPENGGQSYAWWDCQCSCGTIKAVSGAALRSGNATRCYACGRRASAKKRRLPGDKAAFNRLYCTYKQNAYNCAREFALSKSEFRKLTSAPCHFCGAKPSALVLSAGGAEYFYNGIDRIDNQAGYQIANVVACCKMCNLAKRDVSYDAFLEWIDRLIKHQKEGV